MTEEERQREINRIINEEYNKVYKELWGDGDDEALRLLDAAAGWLYHQSIKSDKCLDSLFNDAALHRAGNCGLYEQPPIITLRDSIQGEWPW